MTNINVLMVNYDAGKQRIYSPLLAGHGILPRPASSMTEALNLLLEEEYSGVVINADGFEYLPLLKVMRALTYAPIGVSASKYDTKENDEAIDKGADIYRTRYDTVQHRVRGFSDLVKIHLEHDIRRKNPPSFVTCKDIRMFTDTRRVFVKNQEVELLPKEFDILYYLIINKGIVLSHDQILSRVWGDAYEDSTRDTLWNQISQLRHKLQVYPEQPEYIKTMRGVGYVFEL